MKTFTRRANNGPIETLRRSEPREEDLIAGGKHVLCAYIMKPKAGYGYLETAAHFAAESSTGTNVSVSTTDDFTRGVDALVYEIDEEKEIDEDRLSQ